jgi:glycine betaine/proline transport system substrate-binding protein
MEEKMKKINCRYFNYTVLYAALVLLVSLVSAPALAADLPGKGKSAQPCYNGIAEEYFQLLIVNKGLEKLGYKVKKDHELDVTAMHVAVANGDADYNAHSWTPLHDAFFEKVGGSAKVSRVGTLVEGAVQGYLIDKKTADKYNIETINQFTDPEIAKLFDVDGDGKADLTGCNPGWGCERIIEHQLDAYGLRETVRHNQGSYFALIADTISRYKNGKPILYYTWAPQWVGGVLVPGKDVKWLTVTQTALPEEQKGANTKLPDGRNVGFSVNSIHIFANNDFLSKNPAAKRFFELVKIPIEDIGIQNFKMREGEKRGRDIERHANEWIKANQPQFDAWVQEAIKAAK